MGVHLDHLSASPDFSPHANGEIPEREAKNASMNSAHSLPLFPVVPELI
jgi:hypothetical protein